MEWGNKAFRGFSILLTLIIELKSVYPEIEYVFGLAVLIYDTFRRLN